MAQPTTFHEFPRTFNSAVVTNPNGTIVDTGQFDCTRVFKFLCIVSGTATGSANFTHYASDGATIVDQIFVVLNGAPAEFYWLWLIETGQRVRIQTGALTGTFAAALNLYQAAAGYSIGWV